MNRALVDFLIDTKAEFRVKPASKPNTNKIIHDWCYYDEDIQRICFFQSLDEIEAYLWRFTPDVIRSGTNFTLIYEKTDWLYIGHEKIDKLAQLATMKGVTISVRLIEDDPTYLINAYKEMKW